MQEQDSHSLSPAQSTPTRDVLMEEVEQSLHHSRESFDNPKDLVSEACTILVLNRLRVGSLVVPPMSSMFQVISLALLERASYKRVVLA